MATLGRWTEAKLAERDKGGEPLYTVQSLLFPPKRPVVTRNAEYET